MAAWWWRIQETVLGERGTAYVIDERAALWRHEEKTAVLAEVSSGFAATQMVPGPRELGEDWEWVADAGHAPHWDKRIDQLVNSFWAVHYNDSKVTRNAVFVWAPWPVAMAFGARATARGRGLVLHVRQRPSYGAAGPHRLPRLDDGAHDFRGAENLPALRDISPRHEPVEIPGTLTITFEPMGAPGGEVHRSGHHAGRYRNSRTNLAGDAIPDGTHKVSAVELRLGSGGADQAAGHRARTVLLAMPDLQLGAAAVPSHRA